MSSRDTNSLRSACGTLFISRPIGIGYASGSRTSLAGCNRRACRVPSGVGGSPAGSRYYGTTAGQARHDDRPGLGDAARPGPGSRAAFSAATSPGRSAPSEGGTPSHTTSAPGQVAATRAASPPAGRAPVQTPSPKASRTSSAAAPARLTGRRSRPGGSGARPRRWRSCPRSTYTAVPSRAGSSAWPDRPPARADRPGGGR